MNKIAERPKKENGKGTTVAATLRAAKDAVEMEIKPAMYIMREMDAADLHSFIFAMDSVEKGFVGPVSWSPPNLEFQTLHDCCDGGRISNEFNLALSGWAGHASTGGIAQYSLKKEVPAGVLCKFDVLCRPATLDEAYYDFNSFGEQVIIKTWAEATEMERKMRPMIKALDGEFLYTGPMRVEKFLFTTRVFQGHVPEDIGSLIDEVVKNAPKDELFMAHQAYHLFHADAGVIKYIAFREPKNFSVEKMKPFGRVKITEGGEKMMFLPHGDEQNPKDFSELLAR